MQTDLTRLRTELEQTQDKLAQSQAESKQLQLEMRVVNQFISKFLLGMSRKPTASDINIDKLAAVLEENRDLLIEMTKDEAETIDTGAFLPRALYDLITEVDEANELPPGNDGRVEDGAEASGEDEFTDVQKASPEQIADKLPKVWRVLIELVNHQERAQPVPFVVSAPFHTHSHTFTHTHDMRRITMKMMPWILIPFSRKAARARNVSSRYRRATDRKRSLVLARRTSNLRI